MTRTPCDPPSGAPEAFQGLPWGASEAQITMRFGPALKSAECTATLRAEAQRRGEACDHPHLAAYEVAGLSFRLNLHLDAVARQMVRVSLVSASDVAAPETDWSDKHRQLRRLLTPVSYTHLDVYKRQVRNLAQRSAEAAKEIKSLITASVERVEQGTTLVDQTGATMEEIVTAIKRVTDIMGEINSASREQSTGVNQVGEAVGQMDQVTQQNAALVEESAAAAESLKQQAQQLVSAVAVFKLGSEGLHHASAASQSVQKPVAHKPLIAARPAAFRKVGSKPAAAKAAPAALATDKPAAPAPKAAKPKATETATAGGGSDDWEHF